MKKFLFTLALSCFMSQTAFADAIPPEVADCDGKKAGDVCSTNGAVGTCQDSTCSKLDYSKGSPPQGSVQYPCVKCVAGAAKPAETKTDTPSESGDDKPAETKADTKTGGCAVDPVSEGSALSGLLLLSGVALLARRRRDC